MPARVDRTPLCVSVFSNPAELNGCELNLPDVNNGWAKFTAAEVAAAEAYRADFMAALAPLLSAPRNGGFIDACLLHCQAGTSNWWETRVSPNGGGAAVPPNAAFEAWYYGSPANASWWVDTCATPPCNPTC